MDDIIILIILVLVLMWMVYTNYKLKMKVNKVIKKQVEFPKYRTKYDMRLNRPIMDIPYVPSRDPLARNRIDSNLLFDY